MFLVDVIKSYYEQGFLRVVKLRNTFFVTVSRASFSYFLANLATNYLNKVERVSRLCKIYNTTRKTILKWAKRFIEKDKRGLEDLSKGPKRVWNKKPKKLEEKCVLFSDKDILQRRF